MNDENIAQKESFEEAQGSLIEREKQFESRYSEQVCYETLDERRSQFSLKFTKDIFQQNTSMYQYKHDQLEKEKS